MICILSTVYIIYTIYIHSATYTVLLSSPNSVRGAVWFQIVLLSAVWQKLVAQTLRLNPVFPQGEQKLTTVTFDFYVWPLTQRLDKSSARTLCVACV